MHNLVFCDVLQGSPSHTFQHPISHGLWPSVLIRLRFEAIAAIFFVRCANISSNLSWLKAFLGAGMNVVPYAAFLMLYLMLWITTSHMVIPAGLI